MFFSADKLQQLNLLPSDLGQRSSDDDKIKFIRLTWLSLCQQAKSLDEVTKCTNAYQDLVPDNFVSEHEISNYYTATTTNIPHWCLNIIQRDQIIQSYENLLVTFSQLETENEKQDFGALHADFLNLVHAINRDHSEFERYLAGFLFAINQNLRARILIQWRLFIIRLFGKEGRDDFQYSYALVTGSLWPILAKEKLISPIKLFVAIINTPIIIISNIINYLLQLHWGIGLGFSLLSFNPITILIIQLSYIAQILEKLACPYNQIIQPLSTYTQWSAQTTSALVGISGFALSYGALYTPLLASLAALFPYIQLLMLGYIVYANLSFLEFSLINKWAY